MKNFNELMHKIYAHYGMTMHFAQSIEKGIMNTIILKALENNITRTRYYELLYEKSTLTFGQLFRELKDLKILTSYHELLKEFHSKRDYLAHSYWWDTNINTDIDRNSAFEIISDLENYNSLFMELKRILDEYRINYEKIHHLENDGEYNDLLFKTSLVEIKKYRHLDRNEVVKEIFCLKENDESYIPIFILEDETTWTVGEIGLTQYFKKYPTSNKVKINEFSLLFPINQFNPRPKISKPWVYELDLKRKGYRLKIYLKEDNTPFQWEIKK